MTAIERIIKVIEEKKIQQKELCEKTGINQSTFSSWKKNYRNVPNDEMILIADFLDVPLRYLLTGDDEETMQEYILRKTTLSEQEEELLRIFKSLNMKDKIALLSRAYELEEQNK